MILAYEVEFDASLTGLGFLLFSLRDGVRDKLLGCGEVVFPFDCNKESDYQNTCEFIGVLLIAGAEGYSKCQPSFVWRFKDLSHLGPRGAFSRETLSESCTSVHSGIYIAFSRGSVPEIPNKQ